MTKQDGIEELAECPWCSEKPHVWSNYGNWYVDCETTDCINPGTHSFNSKIGAIEKWNQRKPSPADAKGLVPLDKTKISDLLDKYKFRQTHDEFIDELCDTYGTAPSKVYQVYESYEGAGLITFATRELAKEFIKEHAATFKPLQILEIDVIGKPFKDARKEYQ